MLPFIFIGLALVFIVVYFLSRKKAPSSSQQLKPPVPEQSNKPAKINYGAIHIFYGSQTGTSAKLAEQLAEEGVQQGFEPKVIDLKDVHINHFEKNNMVSVFMLSNTGEGDPPDNTVRWMKILKQKQNLDEVKELNWKRVNFAVFGLGNTQYEHYNTTGIEADKLLTDLGARKICQLGLGDDNCSLEDDFTSWRKSLWAALKQFRRENPLAQQDLHEPDRKISGQYHHSGLENVSKIEPTLANYRLCFKKQNEQRDPVKEDDLDFKTKVSLKAQKSTVLMVKQLRQNEKDGSTLEIQIELQGHPEYQTAGNIALYSKNDPVIVKEIVDYFELSDKSLDRKLGLNVINQGKKLKLNFVPNTLRTLLEESIDLQGRLTKSVLKKLSKFKSTDPDYFLNNSSPKTTEEYKRITEKSEVWYYLIRIIRQFKVELSLEDFVELSDSMAPRLFTIASHYHTHKNVFIAASLYEQGLISKFFLSKPQHMQAELRKSTFSDAMKWKKCILVGAGTGLAPLRAFIHQKVYLSKQNNGANVPKITLFFGCRHENGDFIYKDEILEWKKEGVLAKLFTAFSRDNDKKIYVQNLLEKQEEELKELQNKETAIYICGSLPMGTAIIEVLTLTFGAEKVKEMEAQGRIVKELW